MSQARQQLGSHGAITKARSAQSIGASHAMAEDRRSRARHHAAFALRRSLWKLAKYVLRPQRCIGRDIDAAVSAW